MTNKANYSFAKLQDYGRITGPVTFYALYYKPEYEYTGSVQTFTAPVSGVYKFQLWGAAGGTDEHHNSDYGGENYGGYTTGEVHLSAGQVIYIVVGGMGGTQFEYNGYNGGGIGGGKEWCYAAGGGGATHIASATGTLASFGTATNAAKYVYLVAGGGGGEGDDGIGGVGGGLSGGNGGPNAKYSGAGGTQTSGYAFGQGGPASNKGVGGGGGWYGGYPSTKRSAPKSNSGGGGGSGYINTALGITNGAMTAGVSYRPGTLNHGHVTVTLISMD